MTLGSFFYRTAPFTFIIKVYYAPNTCALNTILKKPLKSFYIVTYT